MHSTLPMKFKAWHRLRECMYDVLQIDNGSPSIVCREAEDGSGKKVNEMISSDDCKNLVLLQASGYKDHAGNDIYDYDLIVTTEENPRYGVVLFTDGSFNVMYVYEFEPDESHEIGCLLADLLDETSVEVIDSAVGWELEENSSK
jgi:YopX protein